jgi:hypothetical protein
VRGPRRCGWLRRTERVDDAFILLCHTIQATHPFATITKSSDTLDSVRALEGWDEEVPWKGKEPSGVIRRKSEAAHVEVRVRTKGVHRSVRGIPFDNSRQSINDESEPTPAQVGDEGAMRRAQLRKQHSRLDVDR